MSLSSVQVDLLKRRRDAAKSALRFFKDKKPIKSTNNPFAFTTDEQDFQLGAYRDDMRNGVSDNSVVQSFEDAAYYQVGNCDEKGRICYSSLISNPRIPPPESHVTLIMAIDYDHVFVIVADIPITGRSELRAMPVTTMIVDGWTEDWYFPKLSWTAAVQYGLSNVPNPRQLYVRNNIAKHDFQRYGGRRGMIDVVGPRGVTYNVP